MIDGAGRETHPGVDPIFQGKNLFHSRADTGCDRL
jgi:hypothetical protein